MLVYNSLAPLLRSVQTPVREVSSYAWLHRSSRYDRGSPAAAGRWLQSLVSRARAGGHNRRARMLQESQDEVKSAERVARHETSSEKELVLRKERGIILRPEVFVGEVDTIQ
jgi:hypothetical protein